MSLADRVVARDRRVVVVGAGSTGLVCAIHLARAGLDVTVLEHSPRPGGASSSVQATLPGFVHDHCAGFNPMTVASPAMLELELENEGLRWVRPDAIMAHPFEDGSAIALHHELEPTVASLEAAHPGAGGAWRALIEQYRPLGQRLVEAILSPLAAGAPADRAGWRPAPRCPAARPADGRLDRGVRPRCLRRGHETDRVAGRLRPALGARTLDGRQRRVRVPPGAARPFAWLAVPRRGPAALTDALLAIASREGVTVRCGAHVERVIVRRGRAAGVALQGGEELTRA